MVEFRTCPSCNGNGVIDLRVGSYNLVTSARNCPRCNATGRIDVSSPGNSGASAQRGSGGAFSMEGTIFGALFQTVLYSILGIVFYAFGQASMEGGEHNALSGFLFFMAALFAFGAALRAFEAGIRILFSPVFWVIAIVAAFVIFGGPG